MYGRGKFHADTFHLQAIVGVINTAGIVKMFFRNLMALAKVNRWVNSSRRSVRRPQAASTASPVFY